MDELLLHQATRRATSITGFCQVRQELVRHAGFPSVAARGTVTRVCECKNTSVGQERGKVRRYQTPSVRLMARGTYGTIPLSLLARHDAVRTYVLYLEQWPPRFHDRSVNSLTFGKPEPSVPCSRHVRACHFVKISTQLLRPYAGAYVSVYTRTHTHTFTHRDCVARFRPSAAR